MEAAKILLVERELDSLRLGLDESLHEIEAVSTAEEAIARLEDELYKLVIIDSEVADFEQPWVGRALESCPELAIILISGFGTIESAVEAMRLGAFDYLSKPIMDDELRVAIERALQQHALVVENRDLRRKLERHGQLGQMIAKSSAMQRIAEVVESVAPTKATVLITGESGTGKTLLARSIHQQSPRQAGPFVEVNCGALPDTLLESELFGHARGAFTGAVRDKPGKFEEASGGTIFLDEVATASTALQVKLLRVIQGSHSGASRRDPDPGSRCSDRAGDQRRSGGARRERRVPGGTCSTGSTSSASKSRH